MLKILELFGRAILGAIFVIGIPYIIITNFLTVLAIVGFILLALIGYSIFKAMTSEEC